MSFGTLEATVPGSPGRHRHGRATKDRPRRPSAVGVCASIIAAMVTAVPRALLSQVALVGLAARASRSCVDTVTPQRFAKTTIVQRGVFLDSTPAIAAQFDLVSQQIAEGVRTALGAAPNVVPENDTLADYAIDAADHTVIASLTMEFTVDSTGHVDTASATDVSPPPKTRNPPHAERYYREFVEAARKAVTESTFHPARWGGCPLPVQVRRQFIFGEAPR